jgi:hypothetical protein
MKSNEYKDLVEEIRRRLDALEVWARSVKLSPHFGTDGICGMLPDAPALCDRNGTELHEGDFVLGTNYDTAAPTEPFPLPHQPVHLLCYLARNTILWKRS